MRFLQLCGFIAALSGAAMVGGSHITSCLDCPPTSSPAPTESPAPSPSPSEAPTSYPTISSEPTLSSPPSGVPSGAPTGKPSDRPSESPSAAPTLHHSDNPTESPAPSPSPSEAPTLNPSISSQPTLSVHPSGLPSERPSAIPTISGQPSLSMNPSVSSLFLIASENKMLFQEFDALLSPAAKDDFEETTLAYLSGGIPFVSGETEVKFESVRVTKQFLQDDYSRQKLSGATLYVSFDVAAFVRFHDGMNFNYSEFVSSIFEEEGTFEAIYAELATSSHFGSTINSETASTKDNTSLIFSCVGISFVVGGLATFLWFRNKRQVTFDNPYDVEMKPTESLDSASSENIDNESYSSYPSAGYTISQQFKVKSNLRNSDLENQHRLYSSESFEHDPLQILPNMYRPALLQTESNIEIPITPITNYDASNFSPKSMEEDEVDSWAPSPLPDDNPCISDLDLGTEKETIHKQSKRTFRFGRKTTNRKSIIGAGKSRSDSASALSSSENDTGLSIVRKASDNSQSTMSSLFSGPSRLLKTIWHTSRSSLDGNSAPDHQEARSKESSPQPSSAEDSGTGIERGHKIEQCSSEVPHGDISRCESKATTTIEVVNEVAYLHSQDQKSNEAYE